MGPVCRHMSTDWILRELFIEDGSDVWELCRLYQENYCLRYREFHYYIKLFIIPLSYMQSFIGYCAGNIIGPQLFFAHEAPTYTSAFLAMMICPSIGIVLALAFRVYLIWINRCRDKAAGGSGPVDTTDLQTGIALNLMDKTDLEMPQFRYVY